jgi:hypothetical protein
MFHYIAVVALYNVEHRLLGALAVHLQQVFLAIAIYSAMLLN